MSGGATDRRDGRGPGLKPGAAQRELPRIRGLLRAGLGLLQPALVALCAPPTAAAQEEPTPYADAFTADVLALGRSRHRQQDALLHDYQADITTRLEMKAGRSRFAAFTTLLVHESTARINWRAPNDLKVDVTGVRTAAPLVRMLRAAGVKLDSEDEDALGEEVRSDVWLDRPWFVPRALGDSIHVMGVPEIGALHPLAHGADQYYRYAVTDSVVLQGPDGAIRAVAVRVTPQRAGPALVAGDMWLDADHGDLVRLRVLFLGDYLWESPDSATPGDSTEARENSRIVSGFVTAEAEVEYGLHENRFWLPRRQGIVINMRVPFMASATVPIRAVTTFERYEVNTAAPLGFAIPEDRIASRGRRRSVRACIGCEADTVSSRGADSAGYHRAGLWGDGRWEVTVPPRATLRAFPWPEPLMIRSDPAEERRLVDAGIALAQLAEELPSELTGRRRLGLQWERAADVARFNRVQGLSLGLGTEVSPGVAFSRVLGTARFGFADRRLTGSLAWRWDGPEARVDAVVYRTVSEVEPWGAPGLGGAVNALVTGHDDAEYHLTTGAGFELTRNSGWLRNTRLGLFLEEQSSVAAVAGAALSDVLGGDSGFPPNPPVLEGSFLRAAASREGRIGPVSHRQRVDLLSDGAYVAARGRAHLQLMTLLAGRPVTLTGSVVALVGDPLPQLMPRLGGPRTVRGYDYGTRTGTGVWSVQLDLGLRRSGVVMPVLFADVGDLMATRSPLVAAGGGLSVLGGLVRLDAAKGLRPDAGVRVDLVFRFLR